MITNLGSITSKRTTNKAAFSKTMNAALSSIGRPAARGAFQCLRQQQAHQAFRRALQEASRQRRHASTTYRRPYPPNTSVWRKTRDLWRENPISVTAAFSFIIIGAGCLLYANYIYESYVIGAFHNFPEEVAKPLRKALYWTNVDLQPNQALRQYKNAIAAVQELNMDPFSDEVIGIYIQLAAFFEKIQNYNKSIEVLERLRVDCLKWVETLGDKEGHAGQRTKVLGKTVQISVKLGELYANEYVKEEGEAEVHLTYAVETVLREQRRRQEEGLKEGEGDWMSPDEIGASFEALGDYYERKGHYHLAGPLYLQALNIKPAIDCHTAVLMNNLSTSIVMQNPSTPPGTRAPTRESLVANGRSWANRALEVTAKIQPPERTEECDIGCATATYNLGEFAEMMGDLGLAQRKFDEAKSLAGAVGFRQGVEVAEAALERLRTKTERQMPA